MTERSLLLEPRMLFLTRDPESIASQLQGRLLAWDPAIELMDNVSTDEITPAWACYYTDDRLADFALVGLRSGVVTPRIVRRGRFSVVVAGESMGCGSSRETAPYAQLRAGARLVIARSFEKIYQQNAQNIGLYTSTDFSLIPRILGGNAIGIDELAEGLDPLAREIVRSGGLFAFSRARFGAGSGRGVQNRASTVHPPQTLAEKILAAHAEGAPPRAGEAVFVRADVRFSHDYVTAMADELFRAGFGQEAPVHDPKSLFLFRDHLTLLDQVMSPQHRQMGLAEQAERLKVDQERFAERHSLKLFGEVGQGQSRGSEAICHNLVLERLAEPGQIVIGTDSHTCMAGALGCLAFGVGATDMANAWYTGDVRVRVPESVRIELDGQLPAGVCAKDVMLCLLTTPTVKSGALIGKVIEFVGSGLASMGLDERATLTNMSVEAGAMTGIVAPDERAWRELERLRGCSLPRRADLNSDPGAKYAMEMRLDCARMQPMVATPGDPRNGVPLTQLLAKGDVAIDIAYGGSCTGSKKADMDMYAAVLRQGLERGLRVARGVQLFIQFGSQAIKAYAEAAGHSQTFREAGAQLLEPSCGACIRAGPGVSEHAEQVTVSAINRNYPGRSGPGQVYLASPLVVAASALAGRLADPSFLWSPLR